MLTGCAKSQTQLAVPSPYACLLPGEQRMLVAELFFSRGIKGREPLSDAEWAAFAAQPTKRPHCSRADQNPARRGKARTRSRATAVGGGRRLQGAVPPAIGRYHHPRLVRRVLTSRDHSETRSLRPGAVNGGSPNLIMLASVAPTSEKRFLNNNPQAAVEKAKVAITHPIART